MDEEDYYCVMVFQRKKDLPELRKSTVCVFQDVTKLKHLREKISMYERIAEEHHARVYVSVNPRDLKKAKKDLLVRLIQTEEVANLHSQLFSSLMRCPVKEKKRFMIDIDTKEEETISLVYDSIPEDHITHVLPTKNGLHLITKPFDIRLLYQSDLVEFKKDGMTTIDYIR